jgi:putative peptidoglycan binding protein
MNRSLLLTLAIALLSVAPASAQGTTRSEQDLFERLVVAEAGGEGVLGQALVARSVLNRVALLRSRSLSPGTYLARGRSLSGVINGRMQYEPVSSGTINRRRSARQMSQAREAIALARDTSALRAALRRAGKSEAEINNLLRATGFRTRSAYNDRSQNYDRTGFGNHVFNTDRFSRRQDTLGAFDRYYRQGRGETRRELSASYAEPTPSEESRGTSGQESTGLAGAVRGTTASGRAEAAAAGSSPSAAHSAGSGKASASGAGRALRSPQESQLPAKAQLPADPAPAPAAPKPPETAVEEWQRGLQEGEDAWKNGVSDDEIPLAEPVAPLGPGPYSPKPASQDRAVAPSSALAESAAPAATQDDSSSPLAQAAVELLTAIAQRVLGGSDSAAANTSPAASSASETRPAAEPDAAPQPAGPSQPDTGEPSDADRRAFAAFTRRFGVLRLGARGPMVARLQSKLSIRQTGFFGMATKTQLQAWQTARALSATGEVDFPTWLALRGPRPAVTPRGLAATPRVNRSRRAQREAASVGVN